MTIKRYWPVKRIGKWRQDKSISELYCMPNEQPRADYEAQSLAAAKKLEETIGDEAFVKFRKPLKDLGDKIAPTVRTAGDLSDLANLFDRILVDQTSEGDADEALLREFWSSPKVADLKAEFTRLRDAMKFGDPLYMARDLRPRPRERDVHHGRRSVERLAFGKTGECLVLAAHPRTHQVPLRRRHGRKPLVRPGHSTEARFRRLRPESAHGLHHAPTANRAAAARPPARTSIPPRSKCPTRKKSSTSKKSK